MKYNKMQSESVHYAKLSDLKSNKRVTRKYIIVAVLVVISLMFFSAYLWRLLRRRSSRTDSPAVKIECGACLNLTLATMSHKKNNHTVLPQSGDLTILSTLQVSKHTSTLQNIITHPAETTSTISTITTTTSEITTIINTMSTPPMRGTATDISSNAKWKQNGMTVAGGNGNGSGLHQLSDPHGLYVDEDATVYVADCSNHRIMKWMSDATIGQVVAGGHGEGNQADLLNNPTDMIPDNESLIICDYDNRQVVRWPHRGGTHGEIIISSIDCSRLTMDDQKFLYISDHKKHVVKRWRVGENRGTVVAGGNGQGIRLNQLDWPNYIFVDRDHSVYVSDTDNDRVMKWVEGAKNGIVVAGGRGKGNALRQLNGPRGVVVDQLGTVYVVDEENHRIMRWLKGATEGSILVGGNGKGKQMNQLHYPNGLSFDLHGNLYVADCFNHRVQKFELLSP